ncbi:MAG: vWA domain-containing protein, partial [Chloroflexota bacterium]
MITFSHPLALLLAIPFGAGSIFLWWDGYTNLGSIRRYAALGARSALLAAVILGLAGASIASDQSHQSTVFVADLSASDQADQPPMHSLISEAEALRPRGDESGVVATSSQAVVEQAPSARSRFQGFPYTFPRGYTNLATGLDLAAAILPTNLRRRIVLMSDGQQNVGNAVSAAGELRREGIRVDVVPVQPPARPEVMVSALRVPSQLRANETFKTVVVLRSTTHTSTDFTLEVDHARVLTRNVRIKPGVTVLRFAQRPLKPGFHTYTARIDPINDTDAQNNQSNAFVSVGGAPRVLVVAANPADAVNVLQSLRSTHIRTHFSPASEAPDHLADLENYSAV